MILDIVYKKHYASWAMTVLFLWGSLPILRDSGVFMYMFGSVLKYNFPRLVLSSLIYAADPTQVMTAFLSKGIQFLSQ